MSDFINARKLPSKGKPGDVYRDASSKEIFLALGDGTLVSIADLLSVRNVRTVGPQGETGRQGEPGRNGTNGAAGRDGKDGADGVSGPKGERGETGAPGVPGKDGRNGIDGKHGAMGITGAQGPKGEKGDVCFVGAEEMAAAVKALRAEMIATKARLEAAFDVTMLEAFRNHGNNAVTIQSYLNRMRQRAGDTRQAWSQADMLAIRKYFKGGGTVEELVAACVKG
jgi:hypothetical protein